MDNLHHTSVRVFKAFSDENRLRVLEMLQTGELRLYDLRISGMNYCYTNNCCTAVITTIAML